jgi:hypothetical protein
MDASDTLNALAALGLFLSAGAGAVAGRVSAKRLRDQSPQTVDGTSCATDQAGAGAELARVPTLELRVREIRRADEDVEWVLTCTAHPDVVP